MFDWEGSGGLAETVGRGFAGGSRQDDEPDPANHGNEVDENPTATLADVVHTAHSHTEAGKQQCEAHEALKDGNERRSLAVAAEDYAQTAEDGTYNKLEQCEIPKFRTTGATLETYVLVKHGSYSLLEIHIRLPF